MKKIKFHSNREYNLFIDKFYPAPTAKNIPEWYLKADKQEKDENNNIIKYINSDVKLFTFKACPAMLDTFTTGYVLKTPCDVLFYEENGKIKSKTPKGYKDFCGMRPPMKNFHTPYGYHEDHFHWYPNWAPELPKGYSALYLNPINHFQLPFITVSGIIDNDKFNTPGLMPFFLRKDFTGIIEAGTPFVQIIPFKRDDWEMELKFYNQNEIVDRFMNQSDTFRTLNGEVYKKTMWTRRKYK